MLDNCFRGHKTRVCRPDIIGSIAKSTYHNRLIVCAKQARKKYRDVPVSSSLIIKFYSNVQAHLQSAPTMIRYHPPSEIQFISLFGYLQNQCITQPKANCTTEDFKQMTNSCESEIKRRSYLLNSDYERHQLLRLRLDTSNRLLPFAETKRTEECLIVRSTLSSIFEIHKKYCLQSVVTRCM